MPNGYSENGLRRKDLEVNPLDQLRHWYDEAVESAEIEPGAMALATSEPDGTTSVRFVLLKGIEDGGVIFFTNLHSRKSREIEKNDRVSAAIWWGQLGRQIRMEGRASRLEDEKVEAYFQSRPIGSQLGAWASPQSKVIPSRKLLDSLMQEVKGRFEGATALPKPPFWGGYLIRTHYFEFWQNRYNRLHDRFAYRKKKDGSWLIQRLAP